MWSGIWSLATARIGFWFARPCGLEQEVAFWFQFWRNSTSFDVKLDGSVLEEKLSFIKILELTFSSKLDWALALSLLIKLPPRKLEPWFVLWSFILLRLLCIFTSLPGDHAWNTIVMSGLVLLVATWNCWIRYKNGYARLLVLLFLPLMNPWLKSLA